MKIKLMSDSSCDLPIDYVKENNIDIISLKVNVRDEFLNDDLGETLKYDWLYNEMRSGILPKTAQANAYEFEEKFKEHIKDGYSIICFTVGKVLSGTFNSANIAKENILEEYPDADISIIDSTAITLGVGALVCESVNMLKEGKDKDYIIASIEEKKTKINQEVLIDDLSFLKNGGRISSTTALVGGLLNIKPTITVSKEGYLVQGIKLKGRKKGIRYLANQLKEKGENLEEQTIFISHGDCIEDAEALKDMILAENKVKDVVISYIGATMGCHGGPGALALVFSGKER